VEEVAVVGVPDDDSVNRPVLCIVRKRRDSGEQPQKTTEGETDLKSFNSVLRTAIALRQVLKKIVRTGDVGYAKLTVANSIYIQLVLLSM
jgi:hypothetical protein